MTASEWTKVPEVNFWASDGKSLFQASYIENPEEEVLAGADEGYFAGAFGSEDSPSVIYVWTGEEKPVILPPSLPASTLENVNEIVEETKKSGKLRE